MLATLDNYFTSEKVVLAVSLELSKGSWKLGIQDGRREAPSIVTVSDDGAQDRLDHTVKVVKETLAKWKLPADTQVVFMYEAGQDGFWIYRALVKLGYQAVVIDPASIPVERHARRAKTDRLDAIKLVNSLRAWLRGERDRMHELHVPNEKAEEERHLVRNRGLLQKEIIQHRDRIRKLLRTEGCWDDVGTDFIARFKDGGIRRHDGQAISKQLGARINLEVQRWELAARQFKELNKMIMAELPEDSQEKIRNLTRLSAIGDVGATRLVLELYWRNFRNRKEIGACTGLVPMPYDSGESERSQGISKQGNRRVRALLIEMAWMWLRYQPKSDISKWYEQRTQSNAQNKRGKRIAIVAVARRLAIALWRYLSEGVIPTGAVLKDL